jgi:hypothetical protein
MDGQFRGDVLKNLICPHDELNAALAGDKVDIQHSTGGPSQVPEPIMSLNFDEGIGALGVDYVNRRESHWQRGLTLFEASAAAQRSICRAY